MQDLEKTALLLSETMPESPERRSNISVLENPTRNRDYLIKIYVENPAKAYAIHLAYVPDRVILADQALNTYLLSLNWDLSDGLEHLIGMVLEDMNNELVPRFLQVKIISDDKQLLIEDHQPGWSNPNIEARLPPLD